MKEATVYGLSRFYSVGRTIGKGAFGVVRVGSSLESGQKVAVKSTPFMQAEMEVLTVLAENPSPFVTRTLDIFEGLETTNIVMEFASGGVLSNWLQGGRLSEAKVKIVMRQVLSGLAHIHGLGVVHRDVKPDNILLFGSRFNKVKLADFGLASRANSLHASTERQLHDCAIQTMVGTPHFTAPEMCKGQRYGSGVDVWACGITMYVMMTGRYPFGIELNEMIRRREEADFRPEFGHWDSDALSIAKGMLCPDPSRRLSAIGALQHKWFETEAPEKQASGDDTTSRIKFRKAVQAVRCIIKLQNGKPKPKSQQPVEPESNNTSNRDRRWPRFLTKILNFFRRN